MLKLAVHLICPICEWRKVGISCGGRWWDNVTTLTKTKQKTYYKAEHAIACFKGILSVDTPCVQSLLMGVKIELYRMRHNLPVYKWRLKRWADENTFGLWAQWDQMFKLKVSKNTPVTNSWWRIAFVHSNNVFIILSQLKNCCLLRNPLLRISVYHRFIIKTLD